MQPWGGCVWVPACVGGRLSSRGSLPFSLGLPSWSREAFSLPTPTPATTFSFILKLKQFEAKHILKCQPTYFVHGMRNARFSENAMFGLDFVLECEMEQMLNPRGALKIKWGREWKWLVRVIRCVSLPLMIVTNYHHQHYYNYQIVC